MKRLLVVLLMSLVGLAKAADTMSVAVKADQPQFQVGLPANPTTGYQWTVKKYDQALLQFVDSQYIASQTKLMGAAGTTIFTFKILPSRIKTQTNSTMIVFRYARPWEDKTTGSLKTVLVNFQGKGK